MKLLLVALLPIFANFASCSAPQPAGPLVRTHTAILKSRLEVGYAHLATPPATQPPDAPVPRSNR